MTAKNPGPIYPQSGVIPFQSRNGRLAVLLITNRSCRRWVIPKGLVERHLTPRESAANEAYEEAGIRGRISRQAVGEFEYQKWGGTCHVEVFLFAVEDVGTTWPEAALRHRAWLSVENAAELVNEPALANIILRAPQLIDETMRL